MVMQGTSNNGENSIRFVKFFNLSHFTVVDFYYLNNLKFF